MFKLYLRLHEADVRDLAQLLKSRHGTADPLVGKLSKFANRGAPRDEPLDLSLEDVETLKGVIADEPLLRERPYRHLSEEIEKALTRAT